MKITIGQLKQLIKEQVEEAWQDNVIEPTHNTEAKLDLDTELDELINACYDHCKADFDNDKENVAGYREWREEVRARILANFGR